MFYVYLLKNKKSDRIYIGFSKDLKKRLKNHYHNSVKSTKNRGKYKLIYYEAFLSEKDARIRERSLKRQSRQKEFLLKNLKDSLSK